jgi:uncharacterized protein
MNTTTATNGLPLSTRDAAVAGHQPARDADRIAALDVLRGFALLGILLMNIQSFSMIDAAYENPTAYGDLSGANLVTWWVVHVLADQKFMTIFSMLFGAGIALMTSRAEGRLGRSAALHYRRMGVLWVMGVLHGYLLWYGDILNTYAMCGFVVYGFRRVRPSRQLVLGIVSIMVPSLFALLYGLCVERGIVRVDESWNEGWRPTPEEILRDMAEYRRGWWSEIAHRAPLTFTIQTYYFAVWLAWRAGGLMLIGMALFRWGFLTGERSIRAYAIAVGVAVLVGIPLIIYGAATNFASGWDVVWCFVFGGQFNYWGSILLSLGWVGVVMIVCKAGVADWLTRRLAAVGQMALTNYLMHTIICTTLFYGHGFRLYGRVERVGQVAIVVAIWVLQLSLSPWWLRQYCFGPAEWLWRSLTYMERQPLRRVERPA